MRVTGSDARGAAWEHQAFLPDPLGTESPDLTGAAYRSVGDARAALGSLDATAQRLPNPRLFRLSTLRLEAQSTAALEGTYEPLARVMAATEETPSDPSLREVLNYVDVAETAFAWVADGRPWTVGSLSSLQATLVAGTASEQPISGQVRPIQVVIGRRDDARPGDPPIKAARFVPPPPGADLESRVRDLLDWMQTDHHDAIDPVVAAAMAHYAFEALHPFHDGNGRLGRLLIVLHLHATGLVSEPTLSVSPCFEARRSEYFDALLAVSTRGDWSGWVEFFRPRTDGVSPDDPHPHGPLGRHPERPEGQGAAVQAAIGQRPAADRLRRGKPCLTITQASHAIALQYPGTKKLMDSLIDLGILAPLDDRTYGRRFYAPAVMEALLSPTSD